VPGERIQHGLNLRFGRVRPDGAGDKEVEDLAEDGRIEIGVVVESGVLKLDELWLEDVLDSCLKDLAIGLDSAVAPGIEKMNQPVSTSQASASNVEDLAVGMQSVRQADDKL
jgi:hypothetical protein